MPFLGNRQAQPAGVCPPFGSEIPPSESVYMPTADLAVQTEHLHYYLTTPHTYLPYTIGSYHT